MALSGANQPYSQVVWRFTIAEQLDFSATVLARLRWILAGAVALFVVLALGQRGAEAQEAPPPPGGLGNALGNLVNTVVAPVAPVVNDVANGVAPVVDSLDPVIAPVAQAIEPTVGAVAETAAPVVEAVAPVLDPLPPVLDELTPVTGALAPVIEVVAPLTDVLAPLTDPLVPLVETLDPIIDQTGPVGELIQPVLPGASTPGGPTDPGNGTPVAPGAPGVSELPASSGTATPVGDTGGVPEALPSTSPEPSAVAVPVADLAALIVSADTGTGSDRSPAASARSALAGSAATSEAATGVAIASGALATVAASLEPASTPFSPSGNRNESPLATLTSAAGTAVRDAAGNASTLLSSSVPTLALLFAGWVYLSRRRPLTLAGAAPPVPPA